MTKRINLDELRQHLSHAKEGLSQEKSDILQLHPLDDDFNRQEYVFGYLRAERLGLRAINRRLTEIEWLPMQLDTESEVVSENRSSMKRWLNSPLLSKPGSDEFGNDFIHSLARCGLKFGWDHPEFLKLAARVANLFRDLSCLIGIVYYCTWLAENRVEDIKLSNPDDLGRTAEEISNLIQSPEIYRYLRAPEQNDERKSKARTRAKEKKRPSLRVIENDNFFDPFRPEPAPVV
jgi:hypothetical protein